MSRSVLLALAFAALAAVPAQAFNASNGLVVEPGAGDTFFVPYRGRSGAPPFWCAAGDYAQLRLGAAPATRIWRLSEPPRRAGDGIRFSLSPSGAASRTGLVKLDGDDGSLSVAHARLLCDTRRVEDD